jgi:hypothetical protein
MNKKYHYETCCVESDGQSINDMRDHPSCRDVTYGTMLRHCNGMLQWAIDHNYDSRSNAADSHGLTLRSDWAVGYYRSVFRGRPCYYLVWSAIEFIWVLPERSK